MVGIYRNYKKGSYKGRRRYGGSARTKGSTGVWKIAKNALKTAKFVKKLINAETKYYERDITNQVVLNTGYADYMFAPAQGVSVNEREGDSVKMKNLILKGTIKLNPTQTFGLIRMIIWIDKENLIQTPSQLLESTGNSHSILENKNQNNKFKSKILLDRRYILNSDSPIKFFEINLKLETHIQFQAGTTITENNMPRIMFISQDTSNGPVVDTHAHITYVDN